MKNKIIFFFLCTLFFSPLLANNLNIQSSSISVDKKTKITIFKNQVVAKDLENNQLFTDFAEYNKDFQILKTVGKTTVITSSGYTINGDNFIFDNNKNFIRSENPAIVEDLEKNFSACLGALKIIKDGWETEAIPKTGKKNVEKISFFAKFFGINR